MLYVWDTEGRLLPPDKVILRGAFLWLMASFPIVVGARWFHRHKLTDKSPIPRSWCVPRPGGEVEKFILWMAPVAAVGWALAELFARTRGTLFVAVGRTLVYVVVGYFVLHLRILFHELAHLLAATVVRLRPLRFQVGVGPTVFSKSLRSGLLCEWRLLPNGGFIMVALEPRRHLRLRHFAFTAAGPASDILLVGACFWVIRAYFGSFFGLLSGGAVALLVFILFYCLVASTIAGMIPRSPIINGRAVITDGSSLLRLCLAWRGGSKVVSDEYDRSGSAAKANAEFQRLRSQLAAALLRANRDRLSSRESTTDRPEVGPAPSA